MNIPLIASRKEYMAFARLLGHDSGFPRTWQLWLQYVRQQQAAAQMQCKQIEVTAERFEKWCRDGSVKPGFQMLKAYVLDPSDL